MLKHHLRTNDHKSNSANGSGNAYMKRNSSATKNPVKKMRSSTMATVYHFSASVGERRSGLAPGDISKRERSRRHE